MNYSSATHRWFCDDQDGEGMTWYATEAEALAQAALCIDAWLSEDGWPPEVECIYVGQITHRAMQVNKRLRDLEYIEGGEEIPQQVGDYVCDVAMRPIDTPEEPNP